MAGSRSSYARAHWPKPLSRRDVFGCGVSRNRVCQCPGLDLESCFLLRVRMESEFFYAGLVTLLLRHGEDSCGDIGPTSVLE